MKFQHEVKALRDEWVGLLDANASLAERSIRFSQHFRELYEQAQKLDGGKMRGIHYEVMRERLADLLSLCRVTQPKETIFKLLEVPFNGVATINDNAFYVSTNARSCGGRIHFAHRRRAVSRNSRGFAVGIHAAPLKTWQFLAAKPL